MASGMAALEIDPVVVELCLGHVPSGVLGKVGAIYNRHSYAKQMAKAWQNGPIMRLGSLTQRAAALQA